MFGSFDVSALIPSLRQYSAFQNFYVGFHKVCLDLESDRIRFGYVVIHFFSCPTCLSREISSFRRTGCLDVSQAGATSGRCQGSQAETPSGGAWSSFVVRYYIHGGAVLIEIP